MEGAKEDFSLQWRWILEHLLDTKDVGTPILREMMSYIPNLDQFGNLHRRIALRYLEEAIAGSRIDAQAIPLVAVLLKESQKTSKFPTSLDYRALLLRVQVEAVIMHIRGKQRDWHGFSQALDVIFPENAVDSVLLNKRGELLALLQGQIQERKVTEVLDTYPLTALRCDLLKCVTADKDQLERTFLDKLLQDVYNGTYPVSAGSIGKPSSEKEESQEDFHSADGQRNSIDSEDETIIIRARNSDGVGEEFDDANLKDSAAKSAREDVESDIHGTRKRHVSQDLKECNRATKSVSPGRPELRRRDQHGQAITSISPIKAVGGTCTETPISKLVEDEVMPETAENSLHVEFLNLGSDGHEEVCHKCHEGGRLLCCDGCPIAVHRRCLGYDSKSFIEEEWFCPLCAQKLAAQAVAKARAEEFLARQRVLQFMASAGKAADQKELPNSSSEQRGESKLVRGKTEKSIDGQQDHTKAVFRKSTSFANSNEKPSSLSKETPKEPSVSYKRSSSVDPYEAWVDISSEADRSARPSNVSDVAFEQNGRKGKVMEGLTKQVESCDANAETLPKPQVGTHTTTALANTNVAVSSKVGQANQVDSHVEQGQVGDGDGHDGDLEEDSEGRKHESSRLRKDRRRYSRGNRIIPGIRRKRLQWTKEEEDALREGVKRFSHDNGSWGFQWTRILEFGQGKFHPSRTDVDLKDKWRNLAKMCR